MANPGILLENLEEITAFFVGIGLDNTQTSVKQQKRTLFDNLITFLYKARKFLKKRTSNDLGVETMRYSKHNCGKVGRGSSSLQQTYQSFRTFFIFNNIVPILDTFRKLTEKFRKFQPKNARLRKETCSYR